MEGTMPAKPKPSPELPTLVLMGCNTKAIPSAPFASLQPKNTL